MPFSGWREIDAERTKPLFESIDVDNDACFENYGNDIWNVLGRV